MEASLSRVPAILVAFAVFASAPALAQYAETKFNKTTDPDLDRSASSNRVRAIVGALMAQNCGSAVKVLRDGLKDKEAEVMLMAGTMYEDGLCVKKDWEQANNYYDLAAAAGNKWAAFKRIAGLARQGDAGGALWWASQRPRLLPAQCYSQVDAAKDPDGFAAELNGWPKQRLEGCLYMAGVFNAISGTMHYPDAASRIGVWGEVEMRFVPSAGTVEWKSTRHESRVIPGVQVVGPDTPLAHRGRPEKILVDHGKLVSDQALQRFARPQGIAPDVVIVQTFQFEYQ